MQEDELVVILGMQWSDDCEPNSYITYHRGSVWIKTGTLLSEDFGKNVHCDIYPICFGSKEIVHESTKNEYVRELIELRTG